MNQLLLSLVLDADGRELMRTLLSVAVGIALVLLLVVAVPIAAVGLAVGAFAPGVALVEAGSQAPVARPGQPPAQTQAGVPAPSAPLAPGPTSAARPASLPDGPVGSAVIDVARRYLGVPYLFGGTNPAVGLDCSGLVQLVFRLLGMPLPRTAQLQYDATARVPQDQLQPGDLVFFARTYADPNDFITHVGIYIGGGKQINAPTDGEVVSVQPVFTGFWGAHYAGAGRVRAT